jgi:hypothetical protein
MLNEDHIDAEKKGPDASAGASEGDNNAGNSGTPFTNGGQHSSSNLAGALAWATERGVPVFPCFNCPGDPKHKRPMITGGFYGADKNSKVVDYWWTKWPEALIGVPTGRDSGFIVADFDNKKGKNGFDAFPDWEKLSPVAARTPTGGTHSYFKDDGITRCSQGVIAPGVDIRGEGGYVIVPPSPGYSWINGHDLKNLPALPERFRVKESEWSSKQWKPRDSSRPVERYKILAALKVIDPDPTRETWFEVGCSLRYELGEHEGKEVWRSWSKTGTQYKFDENVFEYQWKSILKFPERYPFTIGTICHHADLADPEWRNRIPGVTIGDFCAFLPDHKYIYMPTRDMWPAASVDVQLTKIQVGSKKINPSTWVDKNRPVVQMIWAPGDPPLIRDKLLVDGGWMDRIGVTLFNQYIPPNIEPGDPDNVAPWLDHMKRVYPNDHEHILNVFAHCVQKLVEKINHALMLGGAQGIGKDTLLEALKYAVGPHNYREVSPKDAMDKFNPCVKSVVLVIQEARDLGEHSRYEFYEGTKSICAAPPETLYCNEKYKPQTTGAEPLHDDYHQQPQDRRHLFAAGRSA